MEERLSKGELSLAPAAAWSLRDTWGWRGPRSEGACPQLCLLLRMKDLSPIRGPSRQESGGFSPSTQEPAGGKPMLSVSQTRASSAALLGLGVQM